LPSRVTSFKVLTWNRVYNVLFNLAEKIQNSRFEPDVVVGICRGGWVPARVICDLIGVHTLANVGVEFYTGIDTCEPRPRVTQPISTSIVNKKILLVDEVADTGQSLMLAKECITKRKPKEVRTVTMYMKPWSSFEPDYCWLKTSSWLVFPWEINETIQTLTRCLKSDDRKKFENLRWKRLPVKQVEQLLNNIIVNERT